MATLSDPRAINATLTTTTVDTCTISQDWNVVEVSNRTGAADVWFTIGTSDNVPATPTVEGLGCEVVPAGSYATSKAEPLPGTSRVNNVIVKILGNGNMYSVRGIE